MDRYSTILFLDFDGTLHPEPIRWRSFEHVPALASLLAQYPEVGIVVSSSWREQMALDDLKRPISALSERVVGVTPVIPDAKRQREIEAWLAGHAVERWLAIDDMADLFDDQCSWLLEVDPKAGLDQSELQRLKAWLDTGILPAEAVVQGTYAGPDLAFSTPPMPVRYSVRPKLRRIKVEMTHLDTFRFLKFLEQGLPQLGIAFEQICRSDDDLSPTKRWTMVADVVGQFFEVAVVQLGRAADNQLTIVMTPLPYEFGLGDSRVSR